MEEKEGEQISRLHEKRRDPEPFTVFFSRSRVEESVHQKPGKERGDKAGDQVDDAV